MTCPGGALDWAKSHNAKFELDKNALMIFSNKHIRDLTRPGKTISAPRPSITIGGHTNDLVSSTKFLGIIHDQDLKFKEHTEYVAARGKFLIMQTRQISKTVKGIRGHLARQLYNVVAVPCMLYGASVWLDPIRCSAGKQTIGSVGAASKLARVQ